MGVASVMVEGEGVRGVEEIVSHSSDSSATSDSSTKELLTKY